MKNITRTQFQAFPYHLVEPSPWPLLTSFALLTLTISAVLYFHGFANAGYLLSLGFVLTTSAMVLWFRDVVTEGTYLGDHTSQVQKGLTLGVALFIISEVFAFLSVFWAYFHSSLAPAIEIGSSWPPQGISALDPFAIPLLNTILLLSSGATITYAHHALIKGNRYGAILGTILTTIFALVFTGLQGVEYQQAGFTIADSVYGTVFYAATGLHGFHVIIGTLFIGVGLFRIISYHLTDMHHLGFESAILYWHFVDVVWLFLYVAVYWWGS
jgi:cytochrome c oxidase subunit 3